MPGIFTSRFQGSLNRVRRCVLLMAGPILLQSCATDYYDVARHSNDQAILATIATGPYQYITRGMAISRLTDQTALGRVVIDDSVEFNRQDAIARITDQEVLSKVAQESPHKNIRLAAIKRLTDQDSLVRIIKSPDLYDMDLVMAAITNTHRQDVLSDIVLGEGFRAQEAYNDLLVEAAIVNTTQQDTLARVLSSESRFSRTYSSLVLMTAVQNLTDKKTLAEIVSDKHWTEAIRSHVPPYESYISRARADISRLRSGVASRIDNEEILVDLATNDYDPLVRATATARLVESSSFTQVVEYYRYQTASTPSAIAKLSLFLREPAIRKRSPGIGFTFKVDYQEEDYHDTKRATVYVVGEGVTLTLSGVDSEQGSLRWSTTFPFSFLDRSVTFFPAVIDMDDAIGKVDRLLSLDAEQKSKLANESTVSEVRDYYKNSLGR